MKICIISNNKKSLSEKIKSHFEIPLYYVNDDIDEINKIIIKNKEWIIETKFISNISLIANQAVYIIMIKENKKTSILQSLREITISNKLSNEEKEFIKKYRQKIILLNTKKEIKKCIEAIENDKKYWL